MKCSEKKNFYKLICMHEKLVLESIQQILKTIYTFHVLS